MSNSSLVNHVHLSRNNYNIRKNATYNPTGKIDAIVIHHAAGNCSVETLGNMFDSTREVSSNYGIGSDGRVGMYVEESNRSWCSSDRGIDFRAITIEVANDEYAPTWHVSDTAYNKLIDLCADICKRNGFKLNYTGDKSGNLHMHKWYANTGCPGPYLEAKFADIAAKVNAKLDGIEIKPTEEKKADTTGNPYPEPTTNLSMGGQYSTGVKWIQWNLCRLGYLPATEIDGYFGTKTNTAVLALQKDKKLDQDGIVGPATRSALKGESAQKSKSTSSYPVPTVLLSASMVGQCRDDVKWVQERLSAHGYGTKVDGYFGNETRQKVAAFQSASGIGVDGIVGPQTIAKLKA